MAKTYNIAVVGAGSLVGEAILDLLGKRKFPYAKAYALEYETDGEQDVDFGNSGLDVEELKGFDFSKVELVFFATSEVLALQYVPLAVAAGCVVIDDSPAFRYEVDVPLVVPEVNPQAIAGYTQRRIIANPGSGVTQLLIALKPLHDAAGVTRLNVATYQAVSGLGREGVDELARQTAQLLNARPVESVVYPKQIAFNLLPQIGEFLDNGYTQEEMKMVWEVRKILDTPDMPINPTTVRVPVFFGHSEVVNVELSQPLTRTQVTAMLRQSGAITVMDGVAFGDVPTPVTDAVYSDSIYVGRIRADISHPTALNFWVVADNVRRSAALNAVQIAEILILNYWQEAG
ncbi:aspartate-semialdehyde dehydrogenase [Candidatus Thiothrix anitrata]|jgi:aspartate-semialdehyde dehydrogenase|uniref:Aspartate-semialdehyde dehydrogenase n=1 Tax=Candidatus Thiothrix anitrata TaxID=2823902 RepID=A0ABX7X1Z5_9GAMM|nr:aspartate-semialdehyde dehydrogenase [Candidatus Thiothrix anitrata]QTR49961.1 aspartate-semialdehyde dehydrogenase [Candidatus Thiothrix anitrata]